MHLVVNKIISAICTAIHNEFGEGYEIYKESVTQDLQEPCFSVMCLNPTNEQFLGKRYYRQNIFCIQYFPSTNKSKQECNNVTERLYDCLEIIYLDKTIPTRGTQMNAEYSDGVLSFFVNYDMFVYKHEEKEKMETYAVKISEKE